MPTRKRLIPTALLILAVFVAPAAAADFTDSSIPRITVQELRAKQDKGEDVVILDVRTGLDYDRSRDQIKGSVRISIFQLHERYGELPPNKEIIAYCT